jgi:light-regulated signal transduction histidine kinase (bacteriophytochrome)
VEVSPPLREACRNIGQCASSQVERLIFAERLEARILLATGLSRKHPAAFTTSSSSSLLQIFAATFGMLVMNDQVRAIGGLGSYQEALVLVKYFRTRGVTSVIASQKISADFPDLLYPPGFTLIAGLLVIPLSNSGSDFLVVFRMEQLIEIHWAGNTEERFELIGGGDAEPTVSSHRWMKHVTNTGGNGLHGNVSHQSLSDICANYTSGNGYNTQHTIRNVYGALEEKTGEYKKESHETTAHI